MSSSLLPSTLIPHRPALIAACDCRRSILKCSYVRCQEFVPASPINVRFGADPTGEYLKAARLLLCLSLLLPSFHINHTAASSPFCSHPFAFDPWALYPTSLLLSLWDSNLLCSLRCLLIATPRHLSPLRPLGLPRSYDSLQNNNHHESVKGHGI